MLGAIAGDIAGSRFERRNIKTKKFDLFTDRCRPTDDSVMTLAVAKALLMSREDRDSLSVNAVRCMQELGRRYPDAGYGRNFFSWFNDDDPKPYGSYGNGSAMRVSSCAYVADSIEEAKSLSKTVSAVSHDHPEAIKGAEAVSVSIYLALHGSNIDEIGEYVKKHYYPMDFTLDSIRSSYSFDVSCQGSVPQSIAAFLESAGFEDTVRNAISIGGDSDTIAAIAGSIAEAYYGIPDDIREKAMAYLDEYQISILTEFENTYGLVKSK